tara:strand:+ start:9973 stop:10164 length:192 start_codon:yes stop_codon:yes gene_type:complete
MNRIIIVKGKPVSVAPSLVERVQREREQLTPAATIAEKCGRTISFIKALILSIEDEAQMGRVA